MKSKAFLNPPLTYLEELTPEYYIIHDISSKEDVFGQEATRKERRLCFRYHKRHDFLSQAARSFEMTL